LLFSTTTKKKFVIWTENDANAHGAITQRCVPFSCSEINRGGLALVYEILLDTAAADIHRALEVITIAAESRIPQLIFCKLGKDRTGLMSALILAVCGASQEEIVADYTKSDGVNQIALGGLEKLRDVQGMNQELFASAPPEAMRTTLDYITQRWGGLDQYMDSIGFNADYRRRLAKALSPDTEW
jgi:protein tyrosine/serine phosphatase